jgi:hypothetical protein
VFADNKITYFFTSPGFLPSTPTVVQPSQVRCDNALTVAGSTPGCVIPHFPPTMFYSLGGPYPELAHHIGVAQESGLPGAAGRTPLHRLVNPSLQNSNREAACPTNGYPRPVGKSCDEYPFASTREGAFTARTNPNQPLPARTFGFCLIPEPPGTGPVGYSVCMINDSQNTNGGSALGRFFGNLVTTGERVLEGDAFYVSIVA